MTMTDDYDDDDDDKEENFEEQEANDQCKVDTYIQEIKMSGGDGSHLLHGHHHHPEAHLEKPLHGGRLGPPRIFQCELYSASARVTTK